MSAAALGLTAFKGLGAGAAAAGVGAATAGVAGAGAAAAAGGIFSGGGLGLLGSIVGGLGQGMMARAEARERERQKIAEEKRAEARYAGLGEAVQFWKPSADKNLSTGEMGRAFDAPAVGQGERIGEQYSDNVGGTQPVQSAQPRRLAFDQNTGRLVQT